MIHQCSIMKLLKKIRDVDVVRCEEIPNNWGNLHVNGHTFYRPTLWSVVLIHRDQNPFGEETSVASEFIVTVYKNKLYYAYTSKSFDIIGDPWNTGSNVYPNGSAKFADTLNEYHVPDMCSFTGMLIPLKNDDRCVWAYTNTQRETITL